METAKPKKNLSAYMFFCKDLRETSSDKILSVRYLSEMWNDFKNDPSKKRELEHYNKLAEKDAERYHRDIAIYRERNKDAIKASKEEEKQAIKQVKQLQKLKRDEQKLQEKMRELESKVESRSKINGSSRAKVSRAREVWDEESIPRAREERVARASEERVPRASEERVQRAREERVPRASEERVPRASEERVQRAREERVPSTREQVQSKPQNKKELDSLNLLLQKIKNENKPTTFVPDSPYSTSDYDSDEL